MPTEAPAFVIRVATAADSAKAVDVVKEVYDEYNFTWDEADYHADLYDLAGSYLDAGPFFWIAEADGRALGVIGLRLFDKLPDSPEGTVVVDDVVRVAGADCELCRLYVRPGGRKGGIGQTLVQTVIEEAKRQGRERLELWSDKRFQPAHNLYKKMGAVVVGERICDDPDVSPEWGLKLDV